jgi:hypothetical protein
MYCYIHPDQEAIGTCTSCGKLICRECAVEVQNKLVCRQCLSTGLANPVSSVARPPKDRSLAYIIEILPGLFGFLGFGWIYSGNATIGIILLLGFLGWSVIAGIIDVVTGGIGLLCTVPIGLIFIGLSTLLLNNYIKQHSELFGN